MKPEIRVAAFDDGPFRFEDAEAPLVGVVTRGASYVEGVIVDRVTVDGDDVTDVVLRMLRASPHLPDVRALLLDGVTYGGFNVVDLDRLHEEIGVPAVAVTSGAPEAGAAEAALRKHFRDAESRIARLARHPATLLPTDGKPIAVRSVGIEPAEVPRLLAQTTVRGLVPEPLRLARLVASAIGRGGR